MTNINAGARKRTSPEIERSRHGPPSAFIPPSAVKLIPQGNADDMGGLTINDRSGWRHEHHGTPRYVRGTNRRSPRVQDRPVSGGRHTHRSLEVARRRNRNSPRRFPHRHRRHSPLKLVHVARVLNCTTEVMRPLRGIVELALCLYREAERVAANFLARIMARDHGAAQAI